MNPNSHLPFKKAKAPLRADFKAELKNRFIMETEVPRSSLLPDFNTMKRRSLFSLSALVLLTFVVSIVYSSKESPQNILAHAADLYEATSSGIYYEKISYEANAKGGMQTEELWFDKKGDQMEVLYDTLTGEIVDGYLYKVQEDGSSKVYTYNTLLDSTGNPLDESSNNSNAYFILNLHGMKGYTIKIHDPNVIHCFINDLKGEEGWDGNVFNPTTVMTINKAQPKTMQLDPWTGNEPDSITKVEAAFNKLKDSSPQDFQENALRIIQELQKNPDLKYHKTQENGKNYYVFELNFGLADGENGHTSEEKWVYYLDANTYQLHKEENYENGDRVYTTTYEQEILDPSQEDDIYDPSKYSLEGGYQVAGIITVPEFSGNTEPLETGCYTDIYQKLSTEETHSLLQDIQGIPDELVKNLLQ